LIPDSQKVKMFKYLLTLFLVAGLAVTAMAQTIQMDTVRTKKDSLRLKHDSVTSKPFVPHVRKEKVWHPDSLHSPHKAVIRSLIIPGWGQLYNHQWYYVPVIYAGLGLLVDAVIFNENNYKPNLVVAHYYERGTAVSSNEPDYQLWASYQALNLPQQTVYDIVDGYRRDRDLSIMGFFGAWGIQVVQAYIQAKFMHSYTMDTDFTFHVTPTIINQQPMYAYSSSNPVIPGLKLVFTLR
jgi:hypothetical protein